MGEIAIIHYIVHPLWFLDHDRGETISLVNKLIKLGKTNGSNKDTIFVMDMNDISTYFDSTPKEWNDEKLEEEIKIVEKLHGKYSLKLEQSLNESCKNFYPKVPYYWPEFKLGGRRRYGELQLSNEFRSFLEERCLKLISRGNIFGHGVIRDACVELGSQYFVQAIRNTANLEWNYSVCLETTLE